MYALEKIYGEQKLGDARHDKKKKWKWGTFTQHTDNLWKPLPLAVNHAKNLHTFKNLMEEKYNGFVHQGLLKINNH